MRIRDIGEFGLIDRIARSLPAPGKGVIVGIGDDVAVLKSSEHHILATCDIQVEGVHFLREKITPYQLGRKAVAINVSDIAAMGGVPRYLLVSLVLPKETEVGFVDGLYKGLQEECARWGAEIVGGNMAHSPDGIIVDLFLLGEVEPECLLLRSGARVGDRVLVTGTLGDSAAGLALLLNSGMVCPDIHREFVLRRHLTPTPRLGEGRAIARSGLATAAIDVSDGLASDIGHICERSGVGVRLWAEALPLSDAARAVAGAAGADPLEWALFGGEDYELLFTAPADRAEELARRVREETGTPVSVIGEVVPTEEGMSLIWADGSVRPLRKGGWDHFRTTDDGRPTTDDGRPTTDDGRPTTDDRRRTTDCPLLGWWRRKRHSPSFRAAPLCSRTRLSLVLLVLRFVPHHYVVGQG
ncbi:MAG: thiamine-phosphate kinase [Anaerolineae bacterium]